MRLSITILKDYDSVSREGADVVAGVIAANPAARVVAAMGDTPQGLYGELARRSDAGELDASGLFVYQLDEYAGVGPEDPRSLAGWLVRSFMTPLRIPPENLVLLPRDADSAACATYDRSIVEAGGYDLVILGIGANGHIGFNEPPADGSAPTRAVALSRASIASSARYWGSADQVPRRAITVGIVGLLKARKTLLLACGSHKNEIVRRALLGPVTAEVPASYLQEADEVTVLLDRAAWNGS